MTEDDGLGSGVPHGDVIVRLVDAVISSALHDAARSEAARSEAARSEAARSEAARSEAAQSEAARSEAAQSGVGRPYDSPALLQAREEVRAVLGWDGLVDIGGVIGVFTMQNRVADGTGLPLDTPVELASRTVQQQLGVERFQSASNTERGGAGKALAARLVGALVPSLLRLSGRRAKTPPP